MTADGSEGVAVEAQLVPYDASKLELEYTEDKFYLDQMLEMTVSLTDTSDPMNASTESQTVYGVKYKNQKENVSYNQFDGEVEMIESIWTLQDTKIDIYQNGKAEEAVQISRDQ